MAPGASPEGPREAGIGQRRDAKPRQSIHRAPTARYRVASSCGRYCSALRGRTIRIAAFRVAAGFQRHFVKVSEIGVVHGYEAAIQPGIQD